MPRHTANVRYWGEIGLNADIGNGGGFDPLRWAAQWFWSLAYGTHRDRSPTYGYAATRVAAIADFAKSWRRE
jgi:hypothetical protein